VEIINHRRGITPSTALRLEKFFGMPAGFWINLLILAKKTVYCG
jgi:plasmid maintenance system antidote protein VapI